MTGVQTCALPIFSMQVSDLIASGYKFFNDGFKNADGAYQKRIGHTRYFINVYHYDWTKIMTNPPDDDLFECDLQFKIPPSDYNDYINLSFNCTDLTVEALEAKVEKLFTVLEALPYED